MGLYSVAVCRLKMKHYLVVSNLRSADPPMEFSDEKSKSNRHGILCKKNESKSNREEKQNHHVTKEGDHTVLPATHTQAIPAFTL